MRSGVLSGLVAAIAGAGLGMAASGGSAASATTAPGSYMISACSPGSSSGAWTPVNQAPDSLTATNLCGGVAAVGPNDALAGSISTTGGLFSEDLVGSTTPVFSGSEAGWELTVPAGIEISAVSYYGSYETDGDGWHSGLQVDGASQSTDCQTDLNTPDPCDVYNNTDPQVETGLDATRLFFGVECSQVPGGANTCGPAPFGAHDVEAALYSAQVTLVRTGGPIVQGEGGPLWGSGVVSGTVPVSFDATDPAGIRQVEVESDTGAPILNQQQSCTYTQVQACPELPSGQVEINTAGLSDGSHHVQLVLTNAAGDTTAVQGPTVVVDNNGPPAPTQLSATAAGTSSNVIDLAWANPSNPPQPVSAAYVELCQATCESPVQVSTSGSAQITAQQAGSYTVRLWLTDSAGMGGQSNVATTTVTVPATKTETVTTTTSTTTTVTVRARTPTSASCKACPKKGHSTCAESRCPTLKLRSATWSAGWLTVKLKRFPKGDRLKVTLYFKHSHRRTTTVAVKHGTARIKTNRPSRTVVIAVRGATAASRAMVLARIS